MNRMSIIIIVFLFIIGAAGIYMISSVEMITDGPKPVDTTTVNKTTPNPVEASTPPAKPKYPAGQIEDNMIEKVIPFPIVKPSYLPSGFAYKEREAFVHYYGDQASYKMTMYYESSDKFIYIEMTNEAPMDKGKQEEVDVNGIPGAFIKLGAPADTNNVVSFSFKEAYYEVHGTNVTKEELVKIARSLPVNAND
ncbi:DUF4367 domain-containing protein [Fictibacillus aquaticus]|uniref:DUF4367 domain-containing protein n=1 Tax=Fictibacillus aquaticus TaxID=2021314 RepID=A0A235F579_9BACL|nr:DUF4367 domain-containing protein [Fictibacillus aquaticus]OYD56378.1 hypothetical protein CGZ90_17645 [Fictibacillus aquaticus]